MQSTNLDGLFKFDPSQGQSEESEDNQVLNSSQQRQGTCQPCQLRRKPYGSLCFVSVARLGLPYIQQFNVEVLCNFRFSLNLKQDLLERCWLLEFYPAMPP